MMNIVFVVTALIACWAAQIQGDADLEAAWAEYQAYYPIAAKSSDVIVKRKANFAKTHAEIENHKKKNSTFEIGHSKFSTMDDEEKKQYIGAIHPSHSRGDHQIEYWNADDLSTRAATPLDYRTDSCMQSVKNQASCGSCWAFAATAVVEFAKCVKSGTKVTLSEQQLVDCSSANGCGGGWYGSAWSYLATAGGQDTSASYPYTAVNGVCKSSTAVIGAKLSTSAPVTYIAGNANAMISALQSKKLVAVAIAVVNSFFGYRSGVYTEANCGTNILGYHAITVVGYGALNSVDYWVIRNSWGSGWGVAGYILFQRGVNLCLVETYPETTTVV